jgi:poly(3-hydroxybutyrate) depolymerase
MAKLVGVALAALIAFLVVQSVTGTDRHGARVIAFTVQSKLVGRSMKEVAAVPRGGASGRPLLVFLHGRGQEPDDFFSSAFFTGLAALGDKAPVVVALDGGDHSYWHDRRGGRWGSYVLREAIPEAIRRFGVDGSRVAIGGISMGGFGAFDLARRAHRRLCAVGGHSPAFWLSAGATAPGAFDDAADFSRHDVYAYARSRRRPFGSVPLWIDRGDRDPFGAADRSIVRALRASGSTVSSHVWPGAHTTAYWRAHTARYLRFYADSLARC